MTTDEVIKHQTIHNLMDMASSLKISWRGSKVMKQFLEYMVLEVVRNGEDMAKYRKENAKILRDKDVLQALKWMGYSKFAQAKVDEVRTKGDDNVNPDEEVPAGRYTVKEKDTGEHSSGSSRERGQGF